ncbi:MAG TPA: glycosyltransferase, partial [Burkholderiales bacterium]|nr:glycosyltransferase [Burkholderiales bacterium]
MSRITFCWEMGGGLGHLVPLSLLAAEMLAHGHDVSFISVDPTHAPRYLAPHGITCLQAPKLVSPIMPTTLNNHADMLRTSGYDSPENLHSLLGAWRTTLELLRPDRLICEFAPTATLAARTLDIPRVCIDNGFSMPPVSDPMPPLHEESLVSVDVLRESEARTLGVINNVMKRFGTAELPRFSSLYEDEVWYRNWPEFNHFGPHSPERHLGQIFGDTGGTEPVWPTGSGPKMFVYLKGDHPLGPSMLRAAIQYGFRVLAYLPGFMPDTVRELTATGRAVVSDTPVRLSALDDDIEIGVWQSPTGGVGHSLEKGMRMLFLPSQLEQRRTCRAVERSGVAAYVIAEQEDFKAVFDKLLAMPRMVLGGRWMPADIPSMAQILLGPHSPKASAQPRRPSVAKIKSVDVHMLWVKGPITALEYNCISSFANRGYRVYLWTYGGVNNAPSGIDIRDARDIVDESCIFLNLLGSYAGFSDLFRYAVLRKLGGLYSDMDVVALLPAELLPKEPFLVTERTRNNDVQVNGNVMYSPNPAAGDLVDLAFSYASTFPKNRI